MVCLCTVLVTCAKLKLIEKIVINRGIYSKEFFCVLFCKYMYNIYVVNCNMCKDQMFPFINNQCSDLISRDFLEVYVLYMYVDFFAECNMIYLFLYVPGIAINRWL